MCITGQTVCLGGPRQPCYKIAYFRDVSSRVAFREALQACEMDGGSLLSIEGPDEQREIENLLQVRWTPGLLLHPCTSSFHLLNLPSVSRSCVQELWAGQREEGVVALQMGTSGSV